TQNGILLALNAKDGKELWLQKVEGETFLTMPARDAANVYFTGSKGTTVALNRATGDLVWKFKANSECHTNPFLMNGMIFFGCNDRNLYALDSKAGFVRWKFTARAPIMASPMGTGSSIFFGSEDGLIYALDSSTGSQKWRNKATGAVRGVPMIYFDERRKTEYVILA